MNDERKGLRMDASFRGHVQRPTQLAGFSVAASSRTMFASIENDLQVKFVPLFFGKKVFQIALCFEHVFPLGQLPALR